MRFLRSEKTKGKHSNAWKKSFQGLEKSELTLLGLGNVTSHLSPFTSHNLSEVR